MENYISLLQLVGTVLGIAVGFFTVFLRLKKYLKDELEKMNQTVKASLDNSNTYKVDVLDRQQKEIDKLDDNKLDIKRFEDHLNRNGFQRKD